MVAFGIFEVKIYKSQELSREIVERHKSLGGSTRDLTQYPCLCS